MFSIKQVPQDNVPNSIISNVDNQPIVDRECPPGIKPEILVHLNPGEIENLKIGRRLSISRKNTIIAAEKGNDKTADLMGIIEVKGLNQNMISNPKQLNETAEIEQLNDDAKTENLKEIPKETSKAAELIENANIEELNKNPKLDKLNDLPKAEKQIAKAEDLKENGIDFEKEIPKTVTIDEKKFTDLNTITPAKIVGNSNVINQPVVLLTDNTANQSIATKPKYAIKIGLGENSDKFKVALKNDKTDECSSARPLNSVCISIGAPPRSSGSTKKNLSFDLRRDGSLSGHETVMTVENIKQSEIS
jgi:hypothetical protein